MRVWAAAPRRNTELSHMTHRWCVILAGGVGSRFWPLSTPERPKQLLPLITDAPMLGDTIERMAPLASPERTLILTNASLVPAIREMAPAIRAQNVIAEPKPAGTCAALAWAARQIAERDGPDAVMLCVHADWSIRDPQGYRDTLAYAGEIALRERALVTVGIVPSRPDPGFGYIQPGEELAGHRGVHRVARFVEKPDRLRAASMVESGFLWNSGIFAWSVGDLLAEIDSHTPEIRDALALHCDDLAAFFDAVVPVPIDVGVLERSARVLVIPGDFGWDDVGTWAALHRVRRHDESGNAVHGRVHALRANNNVVHAENTNVVLYGVEGLVVVAKDGLVLVTTSDGATDLKTLLDSLPADLRTP